MTTVKDKVIESILDQLFTNASGQKASRLLLINEVYSGRDRTNAHDLGGYSRVAVRDILRDALREDGELDHEHN